MEAIDKLYTKCPFYGVRRIANELKVNRKRIHRLMRIMGIQAVFPKPNLSKNSVSHPVYPYLLKGVDIARPNQVWGVDITFIKMHNYFLYLVALIDWYSRYVLSWKLSDSLSTDFCLEALREALNIGVPDIHNSDQGVQFTSEDYLDILRSYPEIKISMDGRGRAFDNIFTERLWRTIKYEEVYLKDYQNYREAEKSLNEYFNFYNNERSHQSLNYQKPVNVYYARKGVKKTQKPLSKWS